MKLKLMKQKGFTLVEVAIVVAIAALLLIGLTQAPTIISNNKANDEISELPLIVSNIQKIYANQASYVGATFQTVIGLNAFPANRVNGNAVTNRWGGNVTFAVGQVLNPGDVIDLTYPVVPPRECTTIIPGVEENFINIEVNGVVVKQGGGPLNLQDLATNCNTQPAATIVYTFGK